MGETRTEWAIKHPDGKVRPKLINDIVIGSPHRSPLDNRSNYSCSWVKRVVTYGDWQDFPDNNSQIEENDE